MHFNFFAFDLHRDILRIRTTSFTRHGTKLCDTPKKRGNKLIITDLRDFVFLTTSRLHRKAIYAIFVEITHYPYFYIIKLNAYHATAFNA